MTQLMMDFEIIFDFQFGTKIFLLMPAEANLLVTLTVSFESTPVLVLVSLVFCI